MFILASGFGVILSLVFVVSAFGKFADLPGTASGLRSLQIPFPKAHRALAATTPTAELLIAIGVWLPWRPLAAVASFAGLVMMLIFTVVIARALRFPDAVHCSCFGTLGSPTVTTSTLARNITLSAAALIAFLFALLSPGLYPGISLIIDPLSTFLLVALLIVAALLTHLILGGTNRLAGEADDSPAKPATSATGAAHDEETEEELDYLRTPIPYATLFDANDEPHTLRELASTHAVMLFFLSPGCGACTLVSPHIAQWKDELDPTVRVITVFTSELASLPEAMKNEVGETAMQEKKGEVAQLFELHGRPSVVLLGADGLLAGGPVTGTNKVKQFVEDVREQLTGAVAKPPSTTPPSV